MKKIQISLTLLILAGLLQAQINTGDDGKYYADNNSLYNGMYTESFSNGNIRMTMELKNGVADGQTLIYNESGKLLESRSYLEGKFSGTWISFNAEGIKVAEAHYLNNLKDGKWLIWDESGKLRYEMEYVAGQKKGVWKEWDGNGNLIREKKYE